MNLGRLRIAVLLVMAAWIAAGASAADSIKEELEKAKELFESRIEKAAKAVAEFLDKEEAAARKIGNKEKVDQIKAERKLLEAEGKYPERVSKEMRAILKTEKAARDELVRAYKRAIAEYTKTKKDEEAGELQKELDALAGGRPVKTLRLDLNGRLLRAPDGLLYWVDQGRKRKIDNLTTFSSLFLPNDKPVPGIDKILDGPLVTSKNLLIAGKKGRTFFVDDGKKRFITSPAAMQQYNFNPKKVRVVDVDTLRRHADGEPLGK